MQGRDFFFICSSQLRHHIQMIEKDKIQNKYIHVQLACTNLF